MYKKSILSVAIASTLMLTGCFEDNKLNDENEGSVSNPPSAEQQQEFAEKAGKTWPVFSPATSDVPIPNDLIFDSVASDGTFRVSDSAPPVTTALNQLSGASTVAPIDIKMSGEIDPTTLTNNVFLIALDYASGSPVQGLSIKEPPTIPLGSQPSIALEHLTLDGTSYIRINPTAPLNPLTRYVVVVTDGVLDDEGNPIIKHPGAAAYEALSDDDRGLASPALAPVKALVNDLWEKVALNYFAVVNPTLTEENIALSYSFTTSGDEKVLNYIADPAQWFNDQLTRFVGVNTASGVVDAAEAAGTKATFAQVETAVNAQIAAFPSASIQTALDGVGLTLGVIQSVPGCGAVTGGAAYISCLSAILGSPAGPFGSLLPTPASTTISFDETGTLDINEVSSLTASLGIPAGLVSVVQGEMTIPYYLGVPSGANGVPLITESWEADDTLATAINNAFAPLGLAIPQADPLVSTAVNYVFPFPKKKADVTIPVLGIHPSNPAGDMKSVIYQHGITTDRSAALAFGASMVAGAKGAGFDVGVIAIDQPLHGIDGISPAQQAALAEQLLTSGGILTSPDLVFDGVDTNEQSTIDSVVNGSFVIGALLQIQAGGCPLGITNPADSAQIAAAIATVESEVPCGPTPAASLKSAQTLVRTVANGASIIPGLAQGNDDERHFGFTSAGAGVAPNAMDYTGSSAANSSGSLFINLTSFLTSRDNVRQQVTDLLTLRKSLGTVDMNGAALEGAMDDNDVYFIGHSLGTINGLPFVAVANDSTTTSDDIVAANLLTPGAGITRLLENSPAFSTPILAGLGALGLTQDTSSFQAYMNVLQGALDASDPANFAQDLSATNLNTPLLVSIVVGDTTIPNSVDTPAEVLGDGSVAYMSGNEPVATLSAANALSGAGTVALGQRVVRFNSASGVVTHGTPLFPSTGPAAQLAFAEMVAQGTSMVLSGGTAVTVTNASVIE